MLRYAVTYDVVTEESAEYGDTAENGWAMEEQEGDVCEVMHQVSRYGIMPRSKNDLTSWWESEPEQDMGDGSWTTYHLHVKNRDGSPLSGERFARLNRLIGG